MADVVASAASVPVLEVFSTFQGEGPRVGERQIFVRLARCDLRCAFCDTPDSYPTPDRARVQVDPLIEGDEHPENPMSIDALLAAVARLDAPRGLHRSLSITGGEPLLHPKAVRALGIGARALGLRVHLETGGHRPGALREVLDAIDEATPDLKLQSACGFPTPWDAHAATLDLLAAAGKVLAVKVVVAEETSDAEIVRAAAFAAAHAPRATSTCGESAPRAPSTCGGSAPRAPLILQPVTARPGGPTPPSVATLFRLHAAAHAVHPDVRVIPQTHRMMGVR